MKAGWSRNQIQSATRILIKPVAESGVLELYNAKKTIHFRNIDRKEESIQINQYELRWRPLSTESESNEIVGACFCCKAYLNRNFLLLKNMNLFE